MIEISVWNEENIMSEFQILPNNILVHRIFFLMKFALKKWKQNKWGLLWHFYVKLDFFLVWKFVWHIRSMNKMKRMLMTNIFGTISAISNSSYVKLLIKLIPIFANSCDIIWTNYLLEDIQHGTMKRTSENTGDSKQTWLSFTVVKLHSTCLKYMYEIQRILQGIFSLETYI